VTTQMVGGGTLMDGGDTSMIDGCTLMGAGGN
jgi:hypothetical protein